MTLPRPTWGVLVSALLVGLVGCADATPSPDHGRAEQTAPAATAPTAPSRTAPTTASRSTAGRTGPPAITKVLTFVVENHSLSQMKASMPYVYRLAKTHAYADHYRAITHPSLPNYLVMASGGTHGVADDADPSAHPLAGQTVFDQALALGRTATVYADAMTRPCQLVDEGTYAVRHNPWTYFVDGRAACLQNDVPVSRLALDARAGTLPNAGLVVPDLVHDAHDAA